MDHHRFSTRAFSAFVLLLAIAAPSLHAQIVIRERVEVTPASPSAQDTPVAYANAGPQRTPGEPFDVAAYFDGIPLGERATVYHYPNISRFRSSYVWGTALSGTLTATSANETLSFEVGELFTSGIGSGSEAYAVRCGEEEYLRYRNRNAAVDSTNYAIRIGPALDPATDQPTLQTTLTISGKTWETTGTVGISTGGLFGCGDTFGQECSCLASNECTGDIVGGQYITVGARQVTDPPDVFLVETVLDEIEWGGVTELGALAVYSGPYAVRDESYFVTNDVTVTVSSPYVLIQDGETAQGESVRVVGYETVRNVGITLIATGVTPPAGDVLVPIEVRAGDLFGVTTLTLKGPEPRVVDLDIDADNSGSITEADDD
ncbi:MAG: hypothetical protein AAGF99_14950, partial [Bacteroidota bacterium]